LCVCVLVCARLCVRAYVCMCGSACVLLYTHAHSHARKRTFSHSRGRCLFLALPLPSSFALPQVVLLGGAVPHVMHPKYRPELSGDDLRQVLRVRLCHFTNTHTSPSHALVNMCAHALSPTLCLHPPVCPALWQTHARTRLLPHYALPDLITILLRDNSS